MYLCEQGMDRRIAGQTLPVPQTKGRVELGLSLEVRGLTAAVKASGSFGETKVAEGVDIRSLSTETAGGFVGCTVGLYAAGGDNKDTGVIFRSFSYRDLKEKGDAE